VVRSPRSCEGTPLKPAPIVVCARTSLAVTTRAKRHACALRPHATSCGELDGSRHTSGAKASRNTHRLWAAISGYGSDEGRRRLSCSAGARPLRWQRSGQRWRDGPRRSTGTREGSTRTGSRAAPLHSRCWMYAPRWAQSSTLLRTRSAVQTGVTNHVAPSSEGQPFTTGMNAWPAYRGLCRSQHGDLGTTSPQTPTIIFDRRIDGHCCSVVDALRRRL
jgi:hypothetical protein